MLAMPLLTEAEGIETLGPIDGQYSIEVVDFVLEELCPIPFNLYLSPFPL